MERFEVGDVAVDPGTRSDALLKVGALPDGTVVGIPMIIIHGAKAGPVLYLNSGTHGDEPEGTAAIIDVAAELDPAKLRGTLVGVPVLNVGAFTAKASTDVSGTRENPVDWKNLARVFPGRADGTLTERIAHTVCSQILPKVGVAIDFHSGGSRGTSHWIAGYAGVEGELGRKSLEIARLFPLKTLWRIPPWAKFAGCCIERGVVVCVMETTGQGRADDEDVAVLVKGIRNVLRHLGMVEGAGGGAAGVEAQEVVGGRKCIDSETYIYADATGILRVKVKTGQEIKKGELLGIIQDFYGGTEQELRSPLDGIVTGVRTKPMIWVGEPAFLVANFIEEGAVGPTKARTDVTPP